MMSSPIIWWLLADVGSAIYSFEVVFKFRRGRVGGGRSEGEGNMVDFLRILNFLFVAENFRNFNIPTGPSCSLSFYPTSGVISHLRNIPGHISNA